MSRVIRLNIDRLVLKGVDSSDRVVLVKGFEASLARVLRERSLGAALTQSRRVPVLRVTGIPFEPGLAGARRLGNSVAQAIGRGLKS
jgi:hypothetical protein